MYLGLMIRLIVIELNLTMCSLLLKRNSYLLITWRGKGWLSLAVWARFGGALVVIVDEVVIFACFEPTEDKALVVASFFPYLNHPNATPSFECLLVQIPQNWARELRIETPTSYG